MDEIDKRALTNCWLWRYNQPVWLQIGTTIDGTDCNYFGRRGALKTAMGFVMVFEDANQAGIDIYCQRKE